MNNSVDPDNFHPMPPDAAGILSWVHVGDLHLTRQGEQNDLDLQAIVNEINQCFADSISFVYLPGDNADDGSIEAYRVGRASLDRLCAPWCAIVGDHDVHEKSFNNFCAHLAAKTYYAFTVGGVRFLALNAFDVPHPASFIVSEPQLEWLQTELQDAANGGYKSVVFLHCYPSDLKSGSEPLRQLLQRHGVRLVDMGHTHYNEVANDGVTLYTATRSTGQIEEGPVGFSVTNFDREDISWRFFELDRLPALMITRPTDRRMNNHLRGASGNELEVRAKVWNKTALVQVEAVLQEREQTLSNVKSSRVWQGTLSLDGVEEGIYDLTVRAIDEEGKIADDTIEVVIGHPNQMPLKRNSRDQDNALDAWPDHGLLGTRLGPNKNGRKW